MLSRKFKIQNVSFAMQRDQLATTYYILTDKRSPSRSASFCCRGWDAGYQEAPPPSFCCHGIARAPEESSCARHHQGSARPFGAERRVLSVAALSAIELRWAAPSRRSNPAASAPRRIRLRSAIPGHFPARNNRATFETHLAQCPAQVSRVVE